MSDAVAAAAALCEREGLRLTPLRQRVLELVWSTHQPIGAYAILDQLKGDGAPGRRRPSTVRSNSWSSGG